MGPNPCYSQSQVVSACRRFRPVAPFFFSGKCTIFGLYLIQKGVWPYRCACNAFLVTLILNLYGRLGLALFVFFSW